MQFFLDENLSEHVADALNSLSIGCFPNVSVLSTKRAIGPGKTDKEILAAIAVARGVLITRDQGSDMKTQVGLWKKETVAVVYIKMPKNSDRHWDMVKLLIKHWETIVKSCPSGRRGFVFRLSPGGGFEAI